MSGVLPPLDLNKAVVSPRRTHVGRSPRRSPRRPGGGDDDKHRPLTQRELRTIRDYISANQRLNHTHRAGMLTEKFPAASPSRVWTSRPLDPTQDGGLAPLPERQTALDCALRLLPPPVYRSPVVKDPKREESHQVFDFLKGNVIPVQKKKAAHSDDPAEDRESGISGSTAGKWAITLKDYEMRAISCRRAGKAREGAISQYNQGLMYYSAGDFDNAMRRFGEAITLFQTLEDAVGFAVATNNFGMACFHNKSLKEAVAAHQAHEAVATSFGKAVACLNQGVCYSRLGEMENAQEAFGKALVHSQSSHDMQLESLAYGNLGMLKLKNGMPQEAKHDLEQCMELCSLGGDQSAAAVCVLLLGEAYSLLKDHKHACFFFENAFRLATRCGMRDISEIARVNLGISKGNLDYKTRVMSLASTMGKPPTVAQLLLTADPQNPLVGILSPDDEQDAQGENALFCKYRCRLPCAP
eukprot:NODE_1773_length_1613_cov_89.610738_g1687_i0.p1 GENE.NODE_1773_length_1613_cov_89.610738_g1687_i0~~NODE_1773_length_1613_cov_89.610738_g1687_i0.p1  ORF type:complete len:469 (-),score=70.62 NODE_1773_length_1613_cov_89.610738_g1687_i0:121-1527(-)